jgi:hypothetical protein
MRLVYQTIAGIDMNPKFTIDTEPFARCIAISKRVEWDIDADVIRGRTFDMAHKFLPDGLTLAIELSVLSEHERRYLSQIQGRTYANMFGLVERFIDAKVLEVSRDHWLGNQIALEAIVRFSAEELKHQELFRRVEALIAETMEPGYGFAWDPNVVGAVVLGKSTWAVLALTLLIELFTQIHYRESIEPDLELSTVFKDVFLYHWKEESQHAVLDELEFRRVDAGMTQEERDAAVDELVELIGIFDGVLRGQATSDADYFAQTCGRKLDTFEVSQTRQLVLKAYRLQYILSGTRHPRFMKTLNDLITPTQSARLGSAIAALA